MDRRAVELARFDEAMGRIHRRIPELRVEVVRDHPHVEALATFPLQPPTLRFEVGINLQNRDELDLNAVHLWVEWFPCGKDAVFERFVEAVLGLLSGEYRIVESFVGGRCVSSRLQKPVGPDWQTVASSTTLGVLIPWKRRTRIVQNRPAV